jgi:hypothetical protein
MSTLAKPEECVRGVLENFMNARNSDRVKMPM